MVDINCRSNSCVHELFEAQVARTPHASAVICDRGQISFADLNRQSNQVAWALKRLGVGPETLVGIYLERSLEQLVALVGILKAGGAFVPLDAGLPEKRLAYLLADASIQIVVTRQGVGSEIYGLGSKTCLYVDGDSILEECDQDPPLTSRPGNTAYAIYTSGTSGAPKGVLVPHRAAVNHAFGVIPRYDLQPTDRVLQFASLSFDVAVEELLPTWLSGATVVLPSQMALSYNDLHQVVAQDAVTVLNLPAAYWHGWVDHLARRQKQTPSSLRLVIVGSERVRPTHLARWQQMVGTDVRWCNAYGVTEATITTCIYEPNGPIDASLVATSVPIGQPIANTQTYILDEHRQPAPVGEVGELYIGGDGLASGYLNQPTLTEERFVRDPFSSTPGARMYQTGDLVRLLPDGNLEFVGRQDRQIKIRGIRIEPAEIETELLAHPDVAEAVVVRRLEVSGASKLAAYVVAERPTDRVALHRFLQERLPSHCIPDEIVSLRQLPMTASGKIDYETLSSPRTAKWVSPVEHIAPKTSVEKSVASVWTEMLAIPNIGVHDDFFALGGDSITAIHIVDWIHEQFKVDLPVRLLFDSPTVAKVAEAIEGARGESPRTEVWTDTVRHPESVERVAGSREGPLSSGQRRLLFMDQLAIDQPLNNVAVAMYLRGALNVSALEQGLQATIDRHDVLRSTFTVDCGEPIQLVASRASARLPVIDLQEVPEADRWSRGMDLVGREARQSFDLTRGPLLRAGLIRLAAEHHIFTLVAHHAIIDGWSLEIMFRELSDVYRHLNGDMPLTVSGSPMQYGDYVAWQRETLIPRIRGAQLEFWKKQLNGLPPLQLPSDRPRPSRQSFRGASMAATISSDILRSLRVLSQQEGATLFMTLFAAFQTLLYRYSGQEDVAVASPIAARRHHAALSSVGFFVNTLVLRTDLSQNPSFRVLLRRVREVCLNAYANQDLPFEQVVEALVPDRDAGSHPLAQVAFVLQNAPDAGLSLPGIASSPLHLDTQTAKFDLTLDVWQLGSELRVVAEYCTDLFDSDTVEDILARFNRLLETAASEPDALIGDIPLLSPDEEQCASFTWNDARTEYPRDATVHQLFEAHVARNPDAMALVSGAREFTYGELNSRANAIARKLQSVGVGPRGFVGVCMLPSAELVIALLGILKASAAYVPVDPSDPAERRDKILNSARVEALVTQASLVDESGIEGLPTVVVEVDQHLGHCIEQKLPNLAGAADAAYVIHTSGSTGEPKGVAVHHRAIARLVCNTDYVQIGPGDHVAFASNPTFDAATFEIWGALLNGATLIGTPKHVVLSPNDFATHLRRHRITTLFLTTALFNQIAHTLPEAFASVRDVLFGGEVADPSSVRCVLRGHPPKRLIHVYGPTETTTFATWYLVTDVSEDQISIPIGRPIANTSAYVLDSRQRIVPVGVPGELYIGGDGVAIGYVGRPDLTAQQFIPDPFSRDVDARLYRTGDAARRLRDGTIEFIGRLDRQFKIRGFRVEPGEIEAVLRRHPLVTDALVNVVEDPVGTRRLIAYIILSESASQNTVSLAADLSTFAADHLSRYMVPAEFLLLEQFPVTSNGKIDRGALPAVDAGTRGASAFIAPRDDIEARLAGLWQRLLGTQPISMRDDFFAIGGHSLLAAYLLIQIEQEFGRHLPLQTLLDDPTIEHLARYIGQSEREHSQTGIVTLQPAGAKPAFFAVHALFGDVLCFVELARLFQPDRPFYGLQARGIDGSQLPHTSVEAMAASYIDDLRQVQPRGPYFIGGYSSGGAIALEVAQQLRQAGQDVGLVAIIDSPNPQSRYREAHFDGLFAVRFARNLLANLGYWAGILFKGELSQTERLFRSKFEAITMALEHAFPRHAGLLGGATDDLTELMRQTSQLEIVSNWPRHRRMVLDSQYQAWSSYFPQPYSGRVVLFRARRQPLLCTHDPYMGWADVAPRLEVHVIPGSHHTIVQEPYVRALGAALKSILEGAV